MQNKKILIQFIKFCIVGVANTAIGLGSYYLFLFMGINYLVSNFVSWIISVFNAFYWNNRYVFKNNNLWLTTLIRTYISYGFSFFTSTALLYCLVELRGISDQIAPLAVLLVTIPMNFLLNKLWTFR